MVERRARVFLTVWRPITLFGKRKALDIWKRPLKQRLLGWPGESRHVFDSWLEPGIRILKKIGIVVRTHGRAAQFSLQFVFSICNELPAFCSCYCFLFFVEARELNQDPKANAEGLYMLAFLFSPA